jgi:glutathione S-transferase
MRDALPSKLGFHFGTNGSHAARRKMLQAISVLYGHLPADAGRAGHAREAIELNSLSRPIKKARELALRHLSRLYSLLYFRQATVSENGGGRVIRGRSPLE